MGSVDYKIGDKVELLDEPLSGNVTNIIGTTIIIALEDGFEMEVESSQLVKIDDDIKVSNFEAALSRSNKDRPVKKRVGAKKRKERYAPALEVDLHIEKLVPSTKGLDAYAILDLQLETAKRQVDFAIRKRIQKVVFIHGVGDGVLKEELRFLLKKYDHLTFYDAAYRKYGLGATEVRLFQKT
ncbi:Smr/MutS family protein [Flagellimonas lutaonensis]|uniref:Smr protein n=1 Tax=Flagellimonas lutaonensis TaxID=516051 RepID=A0A0D5YQC1_9FLAO|nr:Smr/MutS family protein [Allomuricauda lutaonensis]AKA34058.1 Smr protein [Allomuricauda lutaonensis]